MSETPAAASQAVYSLLGLRSVVYALLTKDEEGQSPVYGDVTPLVGAIDFELNDQSGDPDIQYYDDHEGHVVNPDPEWEGTMEMADIPPDRQAALLGCTVDRNGVLLRSSDDKPPYFAMGFKSEKANGADRYVWLYKCRARLDSQKYTTKQGSTINRQTSKLKITAVKRTCDKRWQAYADTDDESFGTAKATFFNSVYSPSVGG